jgi:hypothetical protein
MSKAFDRGLRNGKSADRRLVVGSSSRGPSYNMGMTRRVVQQRTAEVSVQLANETRDVPEKQTQDSN